ncbi:MAG: SDR family oxidoreductase [Holosporaceae bacterium]|jgi:enoyl-[acyl-carrier protein] reductase I|nr:SDR family oxidoreductase [Holosporaceae bacterium]
MGLMSGKKGIIMGIANDKSLAWGVAQRLAEHDARMAFSYQSETIHKRVEPLAQSIGVEDLIECDAADDESIKLLLTKFKEKYGEIDFIVHAIAFSDKKELTGKYFNTSRRNFLNAMDVSCYSFTALCQHADKYLADGASLLTFTYLGAERVMPNYNVMGVIKAALEASIKYLAVDFGARNIRINGLSAGPVKTLAASGIDDFRYILKWNQYNSPLKRNTTLDDVSGAALFLLSDLSSGITGEIVHVDSGYHVMGMKAIDAPDVSALD